MADDRTDGRERWPVRLMAIPEPPDATFVDRVREELDEAGRRCREIFDDATTEGPATSAKEVC